MWGVLVWGKGSKWCYFLLQQLRKLVLELIHRLPANDHLKGHVKVSKDVEGWLSQPPLLCTLYEIRVTIFMSSTDLWVLWFRSLFFPWCSTSWKWVVWLPTKNRQYTKYSLFPSFPFLLPLPPLPSSLPYLHLSPTSRLRTRRMFWFVSGSS